MRISVTEAKGQLTELVRLAEAGNEVILTRHGHATVRLVPVKEKTDAISTQLARSIAPKSPVKAARVRMPPAVRISLITTTGCPNDRVDTSAFMAILLGERDADNCVSGWRPKLPRDSAGTVAEALIVAARRKIGEEMTILIDRLGYRDRQRRRRLQRSELRSLC